MATTTQMKKIVHIGLGDAPPNAPWTTEQIQTLVTGAANEARQHNFDVDITFIMGREIASDQPQVLRTIREKLARVQPEGVVIGGGLKMTPTFHELFEEVVNLIREVCPAAKLGFQASPGDIAQVCLRRFS